ncbi:MAG: fimbrillin family protein [Bacteroidales bacterium]|nr:fimbrillin family protein [Bacteroidales bacterium]
MKKLVLAALAIGAMAACTKSNVQFDQPGEIAFQPVAQKATKAAVTGPDYPTEAAYNFNVWAWWGAPDAGTEDVSQFTKPYIDKGEFKHKVGNSWRGVQTYYWPTTGSLFFAGYSPADAQGDFDYNLQTKTLIVGGYVQPTELSKMKDLMWFEATAKSHKNNGTDGVPVEFKHALSWLTFKFNIAEGNEPMWTVKKVTLTDIKTKAQFTAQKEGDSKVWSNHKVGGNIEVYNGSLLVDRTISVETSEQEVIVIPQSCAFDAVKLVIDFEQETYVNGVVIPHTKTLALTGAGINDDKWEPGKHYTYTITFKGEEILIAPTVDEWDAVTPGVEIPVSGL